MYQITVEGVTKDELSLWKQHPITAKVLQVVQEAANHYRSQLLKGQTLNYNSAEVTAMRTTEALGAIYGLSSILEIQAQQPEESEKEREEGD